MFYLFTNPIKKILQNILKSLSICKIKYQTEIIKICHIYRFYLLTIHNCKQTKLKFEFPVS